MTTPVSDDMSAYLSGKQLFGDDFSIDKINEWFKDEQEGYANLGSKDRDKYVYVYHQLNIRHGFSHIAARRFKNVLGIGSAYGDEFWPIIGNIDSLTILDPSDAFSITAQVKGVPCNYSKPNSDGHLSFGDGRFDLITSLGVMHHIPNVSRVINECFRCLSAGGTMLIREPIVSMGNWTKPRPGLTKRERGIPLEIFENIIQSAGFSVKRKALCNFPPIPILANRIGVVAYNNAIATFLDSAVSIALSWNYKYHRTNFLEKLAPASAFFVLEKR